MTDAKKNQDKARKNESDASEPREQLAKAPNELMADIISEDTDESGAVRISENVITAVVRKYTLEVPGVVRFASNTLVSGLAEMIGRKSSESNVVVNLENDAVVISVTLVLEFGVRIPEVAGLVQSVIASKVEEITGKHVAKVDVIVQDMEGLEEEDESGGGDAVGQ